MRQDEIDAIKDYNDPNGCYQSSDEPMYNVTQWDSTELLNQTKDYFIDYLHDDLMNTLVSIVNADDDDEAFEKAKEYLEQFSAIERE